MTFTYIPRGVCSRKMNIQLDDDGIIKHFLVEGGCSGNLQGLEKMVLNRKAEEVIDLLSGIHCGYKTTSCPDQMSIALEKALVQLNDKEAVG